MTALESSKLPLESKSLHRPPLTEVTQALYQGLLSNFAQVNVDVVDCPDLRQEPFNLVCPGLGGSPRLLEVGGPPYLAPLVDKSKVYELKSLAKVIGLEEAFIIGAGAGPWPYAGKNCEMMTNLCLGKDCAKNGTHIAKLDGNEEEYTVSVLPPSETRFALLANLFCCRGHPGKVIKVHCKQRTGEDDFITSIKKSLISKYKDNPVGLGGTFLIKSGKAKLHIMPSFSKVPLESDEDINNWLKYFEMPSPLVAVGTVISKDIPGLDLRLQHFHCFNNHNNGGHYHYDTTPADVEYIGYFNIAEYIFRVDRPLNTHLFGRD